MVALHGIWREARLHLWGEEPPGADGCPDRSPPYGDDPYQSQVIRHPAALHTIRLHAVAGDISPDGLLASIADESSLTLWLPSRNGEPLASISGASCGPDAAGTNEAVTLRRWTVPTLAFAPADAMDFLIGLPDAYLATAPDSLRYWHRLAQVAVSLLARQQFVPDLEESGSGQFVARWRLIVRDRREFAWLERCAVAMPQVCRACTSDAGGPDGPTQLVDSFLLHTSDALIRRILGNDPFFERTHARAAQEGSRELRWLSALVGNERRMPGQDEENADFAALIRSWIGQLDEHREEAVHDLGLSLEEPQGLDEHPDQQSEADHAGARWKIKLHLQALEGKGISTLSEVWAEREDTLTVLGRRLVNRRQHLVSELTRAASVCPPLRAVLASPASDDVELTTNEAHTFLREWAPLLRAQGFSVQLPAWAHADRGGLGLELVVRPSDHRSGDAAPGISSLGLSNLVEFNWHVAIGDEQLTLEEFERIAAQGRPLVKVWGHWVDLDRDAAEKALAFMRRRSGGRKTFLEALRMGSGAEDLDAGLPILGLHGTSWIQQLIADAPDEGIEALQQPPRFHGVLRPYQVTGLSWLAFMDRIGIGACLADDMGLGKTIQLLALLLYERQNGEAVGPTLLFAPMSVVGNWEREAQRFAPTLRVLVHHGPDRLTGAAFAEAAARHDIVITTYGLASRDQTSLRRVEWHRLALDEAQKIKNPSANQTTAIRALTSRHRVALTGTPIENHLSELWSIMEMLNPGLLGSAAAFRQRFAVPIERLGDQERAAQLRRMIQPFMLRRVKNDPRIACDLPEKMEMRVYCNLTPEQAAHYARTVDSMLGEVDSADGIRRRGLILATLTKLKQVCNHPSHFLRDGGVLDGRSGKCERLVEMLEEVLAEGDEALVFTQFREMGHLLQRLLTNRLRVEVPFLHGGTSAKERNRMVCEFQDPASGLRVFLLSLKAGGFGLNLTKANHVFHFDRWWNPAVEEQATDRVHRLGQTRRVQVHKFVCIGTLEDRIDQLLTEKAALADQIVGSGDQWLTGLSTADLRDYLSLSHEAIAEP